jgi:hypothetical protein
MPAGDYLLGLACFAAMLIATVGGAWLLLGKRFGHLSGPARALALAILATCGILAVHLMPGILGLLGRGSVLIASGLWLAAAALVRPSSAPVSGDEPPPPPEPEPVSSALAGVAVAAIVLFVLAFAHDQLVLAPGSVDILNFHLPGIGRWIQTGSLWDIHNYVPDTAAGNYPNSGDVLLLAAVLPWHSDFLSHLVPYVFYGLAGLSVYAVAAEVGAPRAAAATAACLVLAIPVVAVPALVNSFPDVVMLAGFGAGLLFLLRHRRTRATSDLVLAGLALGISFGTKWYAVSAVAIVFAVWVVARLLERRGWRTVARDAAILVGLIALAGGFWLLRNLVESGNPVFPVKVELLGITIFDAPRDTFREAIGYPLAHYLTDWPIWREWIVPQYRYSIGLPGALLAACLLVVLGLACRRPTRERFGDAGLLLAGIACALLLIGVYAITPYTAGGFEGMPVLIGPDARYAIPALLVVAVLIAWATRVHRLAPAAFGAVALVGLFFGLRLASNGKISGGVLEAGDWAWALLIALVVGGMGWGITKLRQAPPGRRWLPAALAGALLVAAAGFGGWRMQERFLEQRYVGLDPATDWIREHAPAGSTVGVASTWGTAYAAPLPAFGPRFENEVSYVGPIEDEMLREYSDGEAFGDALERGGFDYLIVGRGDLGGPPADEEEWARDAGWRFVVGSSLLRLFRAPDAPG